MKNKTKKFGWKKAIIFWSVSVVLAVALIVGNYFANLYENLITVFFSDSDYAVSEREKEVCEEVVAEGIVLLKNEDDTLPLKGTESVALFSQNSVDFVYGGAGSGSMDTSSLPTLKDSLEDAGFTVNGTLWDFYATGAGSRYRKSYPDQSGLGEFAVNEVPASVYTDAVKNSLTDDVAIVSFGRSGGESSDLPTSPMDTGYLYLEIDNNERDMLALACEKYDTVIVLVNSSNAMELGFLEEPQFANVKAALWVGAVGQEGIYAIGDVLCGKVNPSGRLADTYAYDSQSAPSFRNFGDYTITNSTEYRGDKYLVYEEGIYVGYRYYETRYEDVVLGRDNAGEYGYASTVQFPFGYGLSYTDFVWSDFKVEPSADGKSFNVSLTVTNDGDYAGKDVVEIYLQSPYTQYDIDNKIEKPSVALVGYEKTELIPAGESRTVTVTVDKETFASYDQYGHGTYIMDAGDYILAAGRDAHDALNNVLALNGKTAADGMTASSRYVNNASGNAKLAAVALTLDALDSTTYAVSQEDGETPIVNQFDDVDVNYYEEYTYLTRSDWTGTMPDGAFKGGSWTASDEMLQDLEFYRADEVVNDSSAKMPTYGSTATSYKVQDLVEADYDDPRWAQLVDQLTQNEITRLVRIGGYATIAIDSIALPATQDKDGPSGFSNTLVGGVSTMAWPTEVVFAATWNDELIEEVGELIGESSIAAGVAGWYAPGVNIHRSPYSGRNFEYFSEDGFLSGKIGAAEMRGVRSNGVIAYMKHFALNDQETNRYGGAMFANEQSIRELYLKGFEYVVREGDSIAVMASMNRLGARWAGAHKGLMTNVLRGEWGFEGMAITDQASVSSMSYQDIVSGLWAGTDIWLNTNSQLWSLNDYRSNATVMSNVHRAAKNIIYSITKSNAVINYSGGGVNNYSNGMPAWKVWLVVLDVVVFGACAAGIAVPAALIIRDKRRARQPEEQK